jgi:protein-L-isoaspartate(D-aspartate) O-methyltransferase
LIVAAGAAALGLAGWMIGWSPIGEMDLRQRRLRMVVEQVEPRGIADPAVLAALRAVPRHRFVPAWVRGLAYEDTPLPIGAGQTISQPAIVALMTAAIRPRPGMRVLEVGTGSGYQAAVLAECVGEVFTVEVIPELGRQAERTLRDLGYRNVHVRVGDGYDGWPDRAPFDAIVLTAAPEQIPPPLLAQLKVGGRLVAPVGRRGAQELRVVTKTADGVASEVLAEVRFVPMTGKAGSRPD